MELARKPLDGWQRDSIDIMLAFHPGGQYVNFEYCELCCRQNGKGAILEARALTGLLLLGEELIMWSAHEYKTAMEAFRRVRTLIKRLGKQVNPKDENLWELDLRALGVKQPIRVRFNNTNGEEEFERLDTNARIKFVARSKGSGRGFSGDVVIIDETFAYTDDQHSALMPTMSAMVNPQIIYTSSPPLDSKTGEILFNLRLRGDPTAPRGEDDDPWEQEDGLAYRDWGLAGDLDNLDDEVIANENNWVKTNPAHGCRPGVLSLRYMRRERKSMTKRGFARERLGIWPPPPPKPEESMIIAPRLWESLARPRAERPRDFAIALHVNLARTHAWIAWAGRREDGVYIVGLIDNRGGTHWCVDRMSYLKEKWDPIGVGVDTRSEGLLLSLQDEGFLLPEKPDEPKRGDLFVPTAAETAQGFALFVDHARRKAIRHMDDTPVNQAVEGGKPRLLAGGQTWDHRSKVEVGPVKAVTLALQTYLIRVDKIQDVEDTLGDVW